LFNRSIFMKSRVVVDDSFAFSANESSMTTLDFKKMERLNNKLDCKILLFNHRKVRSRWSKMTPFVQRIFNATVKQSLGLSPGRLLFGNNICVSMRKGLQRTDWQSLRMKDNSLANNIVNIISIWNVIYYYHNGRFCPMVVVDNISNRDNINNVVRVLSLSSNNFAMCSLPQFPDNFFPLIGIRKMIPMRGKKLTGNWGRLHIAKLFVDKLKEALSSIIKEE
jgi:hypothetical protein